jgi:hypothetical protein
VLGASQTGFGVVGYQLSGQAGSLGGVAGIADIGVGVAAVSRTNVSLYARSTSNLAALFDGDVEVRGAFSIVGGAKSAVVPHKDGTYRQLYCMESPESWFEDFGEARVRKGICRVALDADFAALVHTSDYQVFLTPYDPVPLYVSRRTARGFEIRVMADAKRPTATTARCAYRIVARRKDIKAPRLAKVRLADPPIDLTPPERLRVPSPPQRIEVGFAKPKLRAAAAVPPAPKRPSAKALGTRTRRSVRAR